MSRMTLLETGQWEYDCLIRDTDGEFSYDGGFEAWYKEVFLTEETWEEIREDCNE